jgi:hypothetical protein
LNLHLYNNHGWYYCDILFSAQSNTMKIINFFMFLLLLMPHAICTMEPGGNDNLSRSPSIDHSSRCTSADLEAWESIAEEQRRANEPKGIGTIVITALTTLFSRETYRMNSAVFTAGVTALYEFIRKKVQRDNSARYKNTLFSNRFSHRLSKAFRRGLYASVFNALIAGRECTYLTEKYMNMHTPHLAVNGWKVIGSYIIIDLCSKYSWDLIKKLQSKSGYKNDTKTSPVKKEKSNYLSQFETVLNIVLVTFIVNALR